MIDLGERAVLSVLVQRGGKLPEWKKINGALRLWHDRSACRTDVCRRAARDGIICGDDVCDIEAGVVAPELEFFRDPPCLVRQFNSRTIADLAGRSLVRCRVDRVRRVRVVEITDAGRKALAAWRDPCQF